MFVHICNRYMDAFIHVCLHTCTHSCMLTYIQTYIHGNLCLPNIPIKIVLWILVVCLGLCINFFQVWTMPYMIFFLNDWFGDVMYIWLGYFHLINYRNSAGHLFLFQMHCHFIFLDKTGLCDGGHGQLHNLCHIQHDMFHILHSSTHLFFTPFFPSVLTQLQLLSWLQQCLVPLQFPLTDLVITTYAMSRY